jgi:hypothetical protein
MEDTPYDAAMTSSKQSLARQLVDAEARIEALEAALRKISITIHRDYDETPVLVRLKNIADAALAPEQGQ